MKRAKPYALTKPRNPIARSPLLAKGGPHGKSRRALRRLANAELQKMRGDPRALDES
jgi:hypothetical protein